MGGKVYRLGTPPARYLQQLQYVEKEIGFSQKKKFEETPMDKIKLYGAPLSLYTGRPRSYFIKAGLAYREVMPNTPHYRNTVLPAAGSRQGMPTIETETGEVIRDGVAIIDHYEEVSGGEFSPATPKQRVISRLFDVIGAEGLLRPAMHYRWNYPDLNHEFLHFHFSAVQPDTPERQERAEGFMQQMRNAAQMFGAVPETFKVVEALYEELLENWTPIYQTTPISSVASPALATSA